MHSSRIYENLDCNVKKTVKFLTKFTLTFTSSLAKRAKVIFSQACVTSTSGGGGGGEGVDQGHGHTTSLPPPPGPGHNTSFILPRDLVTSPPSLPPPRDPVTTPPSLPLPRDYAQAGCTHPTRMHSCLTIHTCFLATFYSRILRYNNLQ